MAMKNKGAPQSEEYANVIFVIFQFLYLNIKKHNLKCHLISIFVL